MSNVDVNGCVSGSDSECDSQEQPTNQIDNVDNFSAEEVNNDGTDCELHIYECRYDGSGQEVMLRVGAASKFDPPRNKSHQAAMVLRRYYDRWRNLNRTALEIQSPLVKQALHKIVQHFPDIEFDTKPPTIINEPAMCLFHHRKEIRAYVETCDESLVRDHVQLCLQYMEKSLRSEIKYHEEALQHGFQECSTDMSKLWTFYKPGCLVYEKVDGVEMVSRLKFIDPSWDEAQTDLINLWELECENIVYDGTQFGLMERSISIHRFDGRKPIRKLSAFPLEFHPERDRVQTQLIERGRSYVSLRGIKYCYYDGQAEIRRGDTGRVLRRTKIKQNIMLDTKAFGFHAWAHWGAVDSSKPIFRDSDDTISRLTDEEYLLCDYELSGYCLVSKQWGLFNVTHIQDAKSNENAFDRLVLDNDKKVLISALIKSHGNTKDKFDDHIDGKGKGLVFLLHGPPGVGKTFTAESIAEQNRRPLFTMNSGDIVGVENLEQHLLQALALATAWKAIVLLDEADVFLQRRSFFDVNRNSLVSVLLRVLEYFEGVMFLTTNRVFSIDEAVLSRTHLAISYPLLRTESRRQLWKDWITKLHPDEVPTWLDQKCLDRLSKKDLNGRDIKNIMRIAYSLALHEQRSIAASDIYSVLEAKHQFLTELEKGYPAVYPRHIAFLRRITGSILAISSKLY